MNSKFLSNTNYNKDKNINYCKQGIVVQQKFQSNSKPKSSMNKQNLLNPEITFYIRTAKKLGFIQKSKKSTLSEKELKQIAQKRSKIPVQNQILYFNGEQVKQDKDVSLSEKSIVHVVDSRNVGKSKMKLLFKRLPQNSQADTFEVDSNTSIDHFIKKQLQPFYSQPAEKLFFVYSGRQLKREKSFSQEHVECDTEIICVHEDKDRKNKKSTNSAKSSAKSLKTKDTETKLEQKLVEQKQHENQSKPQNNQVNSQERKIEIPSEVLIQKEKEKTQQNVETQEKISKLYVQASPSEQTQSIEKHQKEEKKLIKSIEEIECNQLESDEDSDNENQQDQQNAYPKKLPEQFLMQQTRPRSHTKSSNNNNSETSSISEPNFKKKKKVSQIQTIKQNYVTTSQKQKQDDLSPRLHRDDSEGKEQSHSPKSLNQQFQQNDRVNEQKQKGTQELNTETPNSQKLNELLKPRVIKTREQIFQSNANTYSSVIDEPEDFSSSSQNQREKQANPSTNQTDPSNKDVFASYFNHHEEEVYNSQLNSHYYQTDSQSLEVKYNKGFMNFSNASFLEPSKIQSRIQTHINDPSYQNDKHQSHIGTNFVDQSRHQNFTIEHRPPEYLNSYFNEHQETHEQSQRKQSGHAIQFYNDSLSFSKQQSEFRHNDESEDNLFVQHRRGHQRNNKSKPHEISESNLLSQTFHNPNLTDHMMNSITFNLEPDEQVSTFKQSDIHIVPEEDDLQENALVSDGKRQSQIQTNFRDSANPSQICSNSSQIHINNVPAQNMQSNLIEPMSLIENLMSMVDYKINVNSVESEDSDDEERKNFVNQQSDIECQKSIQEHKSVNLFENNENQPSKMLLEEQSNVFVQYQSYRADIDSEVIEFVKDKLQASKSYQSNLLQDCSLANNLQTSQQGHSYRKNINNDSQIHQIKPKQSSAIKIVEQESIVDSQPQNNWTDKLESNEITEQNMDSESVQCSGAFHEVSEAQGNEESNFLIDNNQNNEAMDQEQITFRKDFKASQSKMESVQGSKLLYQLSLQAQYETEQPQLLPGDYIYSTDRVDAPVETLDAILASFKHCL